MKPCKQTCLLAIICLLDLISTLWLLHRHGAAEANPLMARFLAHGALAFVLAKVAFVALPLGLIEWARRHRPLFVKRAANLAIAAYLTCYIVGVARANSVRYPEDLGTDDPNRIALWTQTQKRLNEKRLRMASKRPVAPGKRTTETCTAAAPPVACLYNATIVNYAPQTIADAKPSRR
jgi:hypothetical protein